VPTRCLYTCASFFYLPVRALTRGTFDISSKRTFLRLRRLLQQVLRLPAPSIATFSVLQQAYFSAAAEYGKVDRLPVNVAGDLPAGISKRALSSCRLLPCRRVRLAGRITLLATALLVPLWVAVFTGFLPWRYLVRDAWRTCAIAMAATTQQVGKPGQPRATALRVVFVVYCCVTFDCRRRLRRVDSLPGT